VVLAQAIPERSLFVASLGFGILSSTQDWPFQRSAYVVHGPVLVVHCPTARHSADVGQATLDGTVWNASWGSGLGVTDQVLPFHCSMSEA
jgi:hypothetical protein